MHHVAEEVDRIDSEIARAAKRNDHEAMRQVLKQAQIAEASVKRVLQHAKELQHGKELHLENSGSATSRTRSNTRPLLSDRSVRELGENDDADGIDQKLEGLRLTLENDKQRRKDARHASELLLKALKPFLLPASDFSAPGPSAPETRKKELFSLYETVQETLDKETVLAETLATDAKQEIAQEATVVKIDAAATTADAQAAISKAPPKLPKLEVKTKRKLGKEESDWTTCHRFPVPFTFLDSIVRQSQQAWITPDSLQYINTFAERKARIIKLEHEINTMWLVFHSTLHNSLANCGMLGASHDMIPYS